MFGGSQGGLCASPIPSTMLPALWFQIRTTAEQPEAGMGCGGSADSWDCKGYPGGPGQKGKPRSSGGTVTGSVPE